MLARKAYGRVDVYLHSFSNSVSYKVIGQLQVPAVLTQEKSTRYSLNKRLCGSWSQPGLFGEKENHQDISLRSDAAQPLLYPGSTYWRAERRLDAFGAET